MTTKHTMITSVTGKADHCSKQFIRAWVWASIATLSFHGFQLDEPITVKILDASHKEWTTNNPFTGEPGWQAAGFWVPGKRQILLRADQSREGMATIILHEVIHCLCGSFESGSDERVCSTLTARLKPTVSAMAQPLIDNAEQNAAFVAHRLIGYRSKEDQGDGYNDEQWVRTRTIDTVSRKKRAKELEKARAETPDAPQLISPDFFDSFVKRKGDEQ